MTSTIIRHFNSTDASHCCRIIRSCIHSITGINQPARKYLFKKFVPSKLIHTFSTHQAYVYYLNYQIVGLGAYKGTHLRRIYVDPNHQGKQIGSQLVKFLETQLKQNHQPIAKVQATQNSIGFYQKLGYQPTNHIRFNIGPASFHYINMEKSLT